MNTATFSLLRPGTLVTVRVPEGGTRTGYAVPDHAAGPGKWCLRIAPWADIPVTADTLVRIWIHTE